MGFNYNKEKFRFDQAWKRLRREYQEAGMSEESIQALYDFDLCWFRNRRSYENQIKSFPCGISENETSDVSGLAHRYPALATQPMESMQSLSRYGWLDDIDDPKLANKLKQLSICDIELLTMLAFEGYTQAEIAAKTNCNQSVISRAIPHRKDAE